MFYDPPMARIGMDARRASDAGFEPVTASARFPETGRAITMDVPHGLWKLVADRRTGEMLGSQIFGPRADDLIHVISAAMYHRSTAAQLLEMPWYHPTLAEVALSLARQIEQSRARS